MMNQTQHAARRARVPAFTLATALLLASTTVLAHGDHDAPAAVAGKSAPRFVATSDLFEVVGMAKHDGKTIQIYVDRFATNEPVLNAKVEIESGTQKRAVAFNAADGTYTLGNEAFAKPGTYPLVINIESGSDIDILAANFVVPETAATVPHTHIRQWLMLGGAVVAVLLIAAVWMRRTRLNKSWGGRHA